jgi:hypothetical protein
LQTAAVQWQRGLRADAIVWVRKAADTATQLGHVERAEELRNHAARLAEFLWSDPEESIEEAAALAPRGGSSRRVLEHDDDADEIIEVEEIEGFDGDFGETDLPTPDDAVEDLTAEDLAYYREERAAAPVLPDDLDLRSDSERPPARADRDSYMSVSPEPDDLDDDEDSETGRQDSYLSVSPEPDEDDYMDVSPESAGPGPLPRAKISERPTQPRIERPPLVPRISRRAPTPFPRAPAPKAFEPAPRAARAPDLGGVPRMADLGAPRVADLGVPRMADFGVPRAVDIAPRISDSVSLFDPKSLVEASLPPRATPVDDQPPPEPNGEATAKVDGVALESVETLGDLPEEAQAELAATGKLMVLATREEMMLPDGVVLVTRGTAHVTLPHSDVSAARVGQGAVIAARGSIEAGPLRLIADSAPTHLVAWTETDLQHATRDCPWVVDDLRLIADRLQAHASAGLGPLGARLDDALRAAVYERLQVRVLLPDESVAERGKPLKGLFVVAVGELRVASGDPARRIGSGEFVFPSCVIGAEPAPHDVKAGPNGGLVLFATRPVAHELMMSVPPLLEILAS